MEAALTTPWSSGRTEGQVNRIKMVKRAMFGRAFLWNMTALRSAKVHRTHVIWESCGFQITYKFDLLRKRVLLAG